jgi:hypothetical protein
MRGFWAEANWKIDGTDLVLPNGRRIALKEVLQWQADKTMGNLDLLGKWAGWKVRQQWLIVPGGSPRRGRIAQHSMKHIIRMHEWELGEVGRLQMKLF